MARIWLREPVALICAVAVAGVIGGCGCRRDRPQAGAVQQLRVLRQRHAVEEQKRTCYIVAEIENAGELPVRKAKVTAKLRTKSGKERGLNHAFLENVKPGETRILYMTLTTHGSFHRVELSFHEPNGADE